MEQTMELRIQPYTAPEPIHFNFEELKALVTQKAERYATAIYTDEQIQEAKDDRAELNRLAKALNDERIRREKEYMENFNVFKGEINEIIGIIKTASSNVDRQVKDHDARTKELKRKDIEAYWQEVEQSGRLPAAITLNQIFNEKWLNASVKMNAIQKEIDERLERIANDLAVIKNLPTHSFEAEETYKGTLNLSMAISEAHRLTEQDERRKEWEAEKERSRAAQEAARATETVQPTVSTPEVQTPAVEAVATQEEAEPTETVYNLNLSLLVTKSQAAELKAFLLERGIKYNRI